MKRGVNIAIGEMPVGKKWKKSTHRGLWGSIGLHLLIMLIPLSTTVNWKLDDIQLFVLDEEPTIKRNIVEMSKTPIISKAHKQKVRKEPIHLPIPPVTEEETPMNRTLIEPEKEVIEELKIEKLHIEEQQEETPEITEPTVVIAPPLTSPEPIPEALPKSQPTPFSQIVVHVPTSEPVLAAVPTTGPFKTIDAPPAIETSSLNLSTSAMEGVPFGMELAPKFLHREMPIYPLMARKLGKEGYVLLKLTIDENGNLLQVDVIEKAGFGFTEAAVEAVKKSTFLPAKKDGKPIASRALLPIRFRLERK